MNVHRRRDPRGYLRLRLGFWTAHCRIETRDDTDERFVPVRIDGKQAVGRGPPTAVASVEETIVLPAWCGIDLRQDDLETVHIEGSETESELDRGSSQLPNHLGVAVIVKADRGRMMNGTHTRRHQYDRPEHEQTRNRPDLHTSLILNGEGTTPSGMDEARPSSDQKVVVQKKRKEKGAGHAITLKKVPVTQKREKGKKKKGAGHAITLIAKKGAEKRCRSRYYVNSVTGIFITLDGPERIRKRVRGRF
ncbi:MAG: hypothetical protein V2I67_15275 [Thermoanaerobaculales bacterium]|jgi:hypothetical protein|nr:hypothetical protein [Thermoanaerobaculales bacterium]